MGAFQASNPNLMLMPRFSNYYAESVAIRSPANSSRSSSNSTCHQHAQHWARHQWPVSLASCPQNWQIHLCQQRPIPLQFYSASLSWSTDLYALKSLYDTFSHGGVGGLSYQNLTQKIYYKYLCSKIVGTARWDQVAWKMQGEHRKVNIVIF